MKNCTLTEQEKKTVNGCGSTANWLVALFRLPRWVSPSFARCCDFHDVEYQEQYPKPDADWELLNCLYYNASHSPKWQKRIKIAVADLFFWLLNTKISELCYGKAEEKLMTINGVLMNWFWIMLLILTNVLSFGMYQKTGEIFYGYYNLFCACAGIAYAFLGEIRMRYYKDYITRKYGIDEK